MEYSRPSITVCCKEKWTVLYFLPKLYNFQFRDRPLEEKKGFWIPNTLLVISKAWWTESTEHLPWARELEMMADFQHERKYDFIQQRGRKVGDTMGRWGPSWCLRMGPCKLHPPRIKLQRASQNRQLYWPIFQGLVWGDWRPIRGQHLRSGSGKGQPQRILSPLRE